MRQPACWYRKKPADASTGFDKASLYNASRLLSWESRRPRRQWRRCSPRPHPPPAPGQRIRRTCPRCAHSLPAPAASSHPQPLSCIFTISYIVLFDKRANDQKRRNLLSIQWPWKGRFQSLLKTWKGKRLPYCCGSLFFYSINAVPAGIPPGSRWRAPPYGCNEGFCAPGQSRADLPPESSRFDAAALSRQYCGARHSRRPS